MSVIVLAIAAGIAVWFYRQEVVWTPLQRLYLSAYARSALASSLGIRTGRYRMLSILNRRGARLAIDEEVVPVLTRTGEATFTLSDLAIAAKTGRLVWRDVSYNHAALHEQLREWIYAGQTLFDLVRPSIIGALVVFILGLLLAIPKDLARARARRHGRRLKGPELVSVRRFNRRTHADGVAFDQEPSVAGRLIGLQPAVAIPRAIESSHLLIMGDSGTGKSALIRQLLCQLEARGDTAIVYDPALEYTPQFYTPERGDVILNPLDTRSPAWSPGDELRHDAEALTLATSLFPDRVNENPFFVEGPRRIFAHLLTFRPTAEELASWLCHDEELDRRVAGTPYASIIDRQAPPQRSGVLASLNMVADTLKLLPPPTPATPRWSALSWVRERQGWIFLTSTPRDTDTARAARQPVARHAGAAADESRPTGASAGMVRPRRTGESAAVAAVAHGGHRDRKSNNPVVLGFQGRSQLETRYGHDAEAMLSQPATKIFLRTSEPHAAKWISDTIGEVEIERLRESRSNGKWGQQSYGLERQVEPLVMPSEITGLPSMRGYLKLENLVVRLHFPYVDLPARCPAFVERTIEDNARKPIAPNAVAQRDEVAAHSPVPETVIGQERPAAPCMVQEPFFK